MIPEHERARDIIDSLRMLVGRAKNGADIDEPDTNHVVQQAEAWLSRWNERQTKRETVRQLLTQLGYVHEVLADACREFADDPHQMVAFLDALEWPTHERPGQQMRGMIEIFDLYATMIRDTTGERVVVGDLVEALVSVVGQGKSGT